MANTHGNGHSSRGDHGNGHAGHGGDQPGVEILSQMGYESRDISLPALRNWLFGFVIFLVLMTTIPYGVYKLVVPTFAEELNQPMRHQRRVPPFSPDPTQPKTRYDGMIDRRKIEFWTDRRRCRMISRVSLSTKRSIRWRRNRVFSGVTGTAQKSLDPNSDSYPGGGDYSKSVDAANPPRTTPGGVPRAPIIQGNATNPTMKMSAGVGNTAGGTPGVGAPGAVSGTPNPGAPAQGTPTPEASPSGNI